MCDKISEVLFFAVVISSNSQVFREWTIESFENLKHLCKGLCRKCNIWRSVNNNLGLANVLSCHASCKVYGFVDNIIVSIVFWYHQSWKTVLTRNLLLDCSLLAGDPAFVLWCCINCIWGFLRTRLDKV